MKDRGSSLLVLLLRSRFERLRAEPRPRDPATRDSAIYAILSRMTKRSLVVLLIGASCIVSAAAPATIVVDTPMQAPAWARLERQILAAAVPACREFFQKYYDERGYLQAFLRWGANDGPDDAFENFNRWPELHALGADDEILRIYLKAWEGMTRQYSEARTRDVPAGRDGMYVKDFSAQSDWMHHGEGLQLFNRMALSAPDLPVYRERARRFAGLYMGEDPDAPNYDPKRKLIRSMINGSKGPLLRKATALDWVGDPFDATGFVALHGENSYAQFLQHYQEYTDVVGDHFLNLVATTLPTNAYLLTGEAKYRRWLVEYMDAWLARMQQNDGIIPSFVDLDGRIGGPDGRWWGNAYGWGFSPINPVTGRREDRNRIPRALVGFSNALLVTGDRKYVDAWRAMIAAVNRHARQTQGRAEYPTMRGADGWYGWQRDPWSVGALEVWYWSMNDADRAPVGANPWVEFLEGRNPGYAETALERELAGIPRALVGFSNALLVTGDRKYIDAWREMIAAVNRHARQTEGRVEYPTMRGAEGWYGWQRDPWSVGALEVWYWSMSDADRARVGANPWLEFLDGRNASYAETSLERELAGIPR